MKKNNLPLFWWEGKDGKKYMYVSQYNKLWWLPLAISGLALALSVIAVIVRVFA